jgi:hypothetical protein
VTFYSLNYYCSFLSALKSCLVVYIVKKDWLKPVSMTVQRAYILFEILKRFRFAHGHTKNIKREKHMSGCGGRMG